MRYADKFPDCVANLTLAIFLFSLTTHLRVCKSVKPELLLLQVVDRTWGETKGELLLRLLSTIIKKFALSPV